MGKDIWIYVHFQILNTLKRISYDFYVLRKISNALFDIFYLSMKN